MTSPASIAAALLLLASVQAAGQQYPAVSLPHPTGPYPIGTRVEVVIDSTRGDLHGAAGPRALRIRYWYPGASTGGVPVPYMDAPTAATWVERHGFPAGFERHVRTHAFADAPLVAREAPWPLLLFSHGMSWPTAMYQVFFEELASHGYVIAAVDHTGYADAIVFPDGRVAGFTAWSEMPEAQERRRALLAAHLPTWVADLRFALDEIGRSAAAGRVFHRSIDTSGTGVFGHSFGGGAAVRLMEADPRVVAAVNLEGSAYAADTFPVVVREPLLHVVGGYNEGDLVATEFVPDDAPLYELVVQGTFHSTFSDLIYLHAFKADDEWRWRHRFDLEPARAIRIANDYLLAFFDRYVKRVNDAREDLLHLRSVADRESSETRGYPEVELLVDY